MPMAHRAAWAPGLAAAGAQALGQPEFLRVNRHPGRTPGIPIIRTNPTLIF